MSIYSTRWRSCKILRFLCQAVLHYHSGVKSEERENGIKGTEKKEQKFPLPWPWLTWCESLCGMGFVFPWKFHSKFEACLFLKVLYIQLTYGIWFGRIQYFLRRSQCMGTDVGGAIQQVVCHSRSNFPPWSKSAPKFTTCTHKCRVKTFPWPPIQPGRFSKIRTVDHVSHDIAYLIVVLAARQTTGLLSMRLFQYGIVSIVTSRPHGCYTQWKHKIDKQHMD